MSEAPQKDIDALVALYAQGRLDDAEARAQQLIGEAPNRAILHNILGAVLAAQGRQRDAVASYRRAVGIDPDYAEAHNNLATELRKDGAIDEAIAGFRRATEIKPDFAEAHSNLAAALQETGALEEAVGSYRRALELEPGFFEDHNDLGIALQQLDRLDEAIASYERAIEARPDFAEACYNLGKAHDQAGRPRDAVSSYEQALVIRPDYAEAHNRLGLSLQELGRLDEAEASHREAIRLKPGDGAGYGFLGDAVMARGRIDEAAALYRQAIEKEPGLAAAYNALARAVRRTQEDDEVASMLALYESPDCTDEQKLHLAFALGKTFDDIGEYERGFRYLRDGNRLMRARLPFSHGDTAETFQALRHVFSAAFFSEHAGWGVESQTPVFVVGLPRSGTSLVEQMLASHPEVSGAGELTALMELVQAALTEHGLPYPGGIRKLDRDALDGIGSAYLDHLAEHGGQAARVIDKMPSNFSNIGLIRTVLPDARIIHVQRDPMATGFSIFATLFRGIHRYAYDLADIGAYYRLYREMMAHWRGVLPGAVLDLGYEELVEAPERHIRRMLDYCGLSFDPACLDFHKTERPVRTASAAQVRQPLYRDALEHWRRYEAQLTPLAKAIKG